MKYSLDFNYNKRLSPLVEVTGAAVLNRGYNGSAD